MHTIYDNSGATFKVHGYSTINGKKRVIYATNSPQYGAVVPTYHPEAGSYRVEQSPADTAAIAHLKMLDDEYTSLDKQIEQLKIRKHAVMAEQREVFNNLEGPRADETLPRIPASRVMREMDSEEERKALRAAGEPIKGVTSLARLVKLEVK